MALNIVKLLIMTVRFLHNTPSVLITAVQSFGEFQKLALSNSN
jgi:hypothetical protein